MKTNQFSGALHVPVGQEVNFLINTVNALSEQVNNFQHRCLQLVDCEVKTAADACYLRAAAFAAFGLVFPPLLIGAAYNIIRAKQAEKGGDNGNA